MVALSDTGIPKVNVSLSAANDEEPDVDTLVLPCSGFAPDYIVDATSEEQSQMSSAVSVSVNRHGKICGLTKRGGAGLDPSVIFDMISVAKHVNQQFIGVLDSEIAAAEAEADE
nr:unnamed protein product [Digitaria exilis]